MPGPVFRRGESVALHPVEEDDLSFCKRLRNDPDVRYAMRFTQPENELAIREWFEEHVSKSDDEGAQFVVCPLADDPDPVGFVSLFDVQRPASHGEVACVIDPDEQGNGYGTEATALLVGYGIDERRLHRIRARALAGSEAARRVLDRVGFTEEETQRAELLVNGEYRDVVRYSMLEDEWGDD